MEVCGRGLTDNSIIFQEREAQGKGDYEGGSSVESIGPGGGVMAMLKAKAAALNKKSDKSKPSSSSTTTNSNSNSNSNSNVGIKAPIEFPSIESFLGWRVDVAQRMSSHFPIAFSAVFTALVDTSPLLASTLCEGKSLVYIYI